MAINFLPWREKAYFKSKRLFYYTFFFSLSLAIAALLISYGFFSKQKNKIRLQNRFLSKQIEIYQQKNKNQQVLFGENQQKNQLFKLIQDEMEEKKNLHSFLEKLGAIHLKDFYLTQIIWNKNHKALSGVSSSMENIFIFIREIKPFSKGVHFINIAVSEIGKITFKLGIDVY